MNTCSLLYPIKIINMNSCSSICLILPDIADFVGYNIMTHIYLEDIRVIDSIPILININI